jgi:DNA-binding FadR family transcriptional regulator
MHLVQELPGLDRELSKRTIKEQISDKLAYMICSGLLQVGDELPSERDLAATLDVSRETVRGAIQTLAALRMIEVAQGARTRVVRTDGYELHDVVAALRGLQRHGPHTVNEARLAMETAVIRVAAGRITDKDLRRMERLLQAQAGMFDDPVQFQISDREFHSIMYEASGNALLASYAHDLYAHALGTRRTVLKRTGSVRQGYEDHLAIYHALNTRDPERAAAAVVRHLDHAYDAGPGQEAGTHA